MFATELFNTEFMSFLNKNKKWMPSHFGSSHSWTVSFLHNIFVWSSSFTIDNHHVQKTILSKKYWEYSLSCVALY